MAVRITQPAPRRVDRDESFSKNEKDKMPKAALNIKVCLNYILVASLSLSISEHRIQADEVDREYL